MKKVIILILAAAMLGSTPAATADTQDASSYSDTRATTRSSDVSVSAVVKTNGGNLNMRSSPSESAAIITKLPNGTKITIYGSAQNGFFKTNYGGNTGYVSAAYVAADTSAGVSASVKTNGGNLNVRSSPSESASIITKLANGTKITLYGGTQNGFYKALCGNYIGYVSASYVSKSASGLVGNANRVSLLKQRSGECKSTAAAQAVNIILGYDGYSASDMGGGTCKNLNGYTYKGSDGNKYTVTYKTDSYIGSASEQKKQIDAAVSAGLPIIVTVHKISSGTQHHWVTIIGKSGDTYDIIDPATGTRRTMSDAGYTFGLADYSDGLHYGYISFSK